jgi:hypothetical protein
MSLDYNTAWVDKGWINDILCGLDRIYKSESVYASCFQMLTMGENHRERDMVFSAHFGDEAISLFMPLVFNRASKATTVFYDLCYYSITWNVGSIENVRFVPGVRFGNGCADCFDCDLICGLVDGGLNPYHVIELGGRTHATVRFVAKVASLSPGFTFGDTYCLNSGVRHQDLETSDPYIECVFVIQRGPCEPFEDSFIKMCCVEIRNPFAFLKRNFKKRDTYTPFLDYRVALNGRLIQHFAGSECEKSPRFVDV